MANNTQSLPQEVKKRNDVKIGKVTGANVKNDKVLRSEIYH